MTGHGLAETMCKVDRGIVGRKKVVNVMVGDNVFARAYGNGIVTKINGKKIYVDFNGKLRIFSIEYLYKA